MEDASGHRNSPSFTGERVIVILAGLELRLRRAAEQAAGRGRRRLGDGGVRGSRATPDARDEKSPATATMRRSPKRVGRRETRHAPVSPSPRGDGVPSARTWQPVAERRWVHVTDGIGGRRWSHASVIDDVCSS